MNLNDAGKMVEKWYFELENKFPDIKCHSMIVMPNNFHCIVENVGDVPGNVSVHGNISDDVTIGADLCVCPYYPGEHDLMGNPVNWGEHNLMGNPVNWGEHDLMGNPDNWGEHDLIGESG